MTALSAANIIPLNPSPAAPTAGLCPWEDPQAFTELRRALTSVHAPAGPTETSLVERLAIIEWRRRRLVAAEAAVHVAHAFDRANEDSIKRKTLIRAGVTDYKTRDQLSVAEVLRGSDEDDAETLAAIREGITDCEAAVHLLDAGATYEAALVRMDDDLREWWLSELSETSDGKPKYQQDAASLRAFLDGDALPWRRGWLKTNAVRPAIRAQAIAESFDPARLRQLWDMEARLDRQFEKALSMLIRLQEMRSAGAAS